MFPTGGLPLIHSLPGRWYNAIRLMFGSGGRVTTYKLLEKSQELVSSHLQRWPCCSGEKLKGKTNYS